MSKEAVGAEHDSAVCQGVLDFLNHTMVTLDEFAVDREGKYQHWDGHLLWRCVRSVAPVDALLVANLAVFFTVLRYAMNATVFLPLCRYLRLMPSEAEKFPESAWKLLSYVGLWSYSLYVIVLSGRHHFFQHPCLVWQDFTMDSAFWKDEFWQLGVDVDIYWMYILATAYYVHSLYATLYMDVWKKDSTMMLLHHCITLFLLVFSFLMKYHRIGALVLFLHDISDVLLELTKINVYLKTRGNRFHMLHEVVSTVLFLLFTASWAWFRIYWYAIKVLHASNWCVYLQFRDRQPKLYLFFNAMLLALETMHIFWFATILKLLVRIATGQMRDGVEDEREFDVANKSQPQQPPRDGQTTDQLHNDDEQQKKRD